MPALPTIPTITDGPSSSSQLRQLADALRFLYLVPVANLRQTTGQSFTSGAGAAVAFNAEDIDADVDGVGGGHDNVTNNTRWTARYQGVHVLAGGVTFVANVTGLRLTWWRVNGIDINGSQIELTATAGGGVTSMPARTIGQYLAQGDYVELMAMQTSGGALLSSVSTIEQPHMSIFWKARQSF